MLTTFTEKVFAAFKREPIAFGLLTFLLLAGATAGMTARQILTAAPAASGAVDLASTTGTEGTGTAMMRADAVLGVKGILPVAKGGTGTSTGTFTGNLQLVDGLVGTPSYSWANETNTGFYRAGAGDIRHSIGGVDVTKWTSNGQRGANGAVATPSWSFLNDTGSGLYRIGASDIGMAVGGAKLSEWNAVGLSVGSAAVSYPFEVNGSGDTSASIGISNSAMTGTPILHMTMNNGNGAAVFEIAKLSGTPTLGYKFFSLNAGVTVNPFTLSATGIGQSVGFKHQRFGASCNTTAVAGNTCGSTYTWASAFTDANYTVTCTGVLSSGIPILMYGTKLAASIQVVVQAASAAVAAFTGVDCFAAHD